ncbi:MAG: AAA family ATPase [Propionibacteriaceae bacterium]|nr:AAA family ATPase [Propionibacteriaceae bacterium]
MAESTIILTKQHDALDGSVKQKVMTFLEKLAADDAAPGLHIEPVRNAADPRTRTGRVDLNYRALLFKLTGETTTYVLHGVYPHDQAYEKAQITRLRVNPVNGITDFTTVAAESPASYVAPAASTFQAPGPAPLIPFSAEDLVVSLGIPPEVARIAVRLTSQQTMQDFACKLPEWQGLALLMLADGESITGVGKELMILNAERPDSQQIEAAFEKAEKAFEKSEQPELFSDQDLLDGFDKPGAQMGFAKLAGADELRRVILDNDFSAWRVFLHPQQRKWVHRDRRGSFRLGGGAGTGKTVVVVHRGRWLAQQHPGVSVLLTTFNTNIAAELDRSLTSLDPKLPRADAAGRPGVYVKGIDALASEILRLAGANIARACAEVLGKGRSAVQHRTARGAWREAIETAGHGLPELLRRDVFLQSEYETVILPERITSEQEYLRAPRRGRGVRLSRADRRAVWAVVSAYRAAALQNDTVDFAEAAMIAAVHLENTRQVQFRHVLVDEGQDFKPCHWRLVRALTPSQDNDIFIVEDSHQRIYGQKVVLSHHGIDIRGRAARLRLSYRTTAQNLELAVRILEGHTFVDSQGNEDPLDGYLAARTGPQPRVKRFGSLADELAFAAEILRGWLKEGTAPEALAVLVRDTTTRTRVVDGLAERGVTVRPLDKGVPQPGPPVALTMHRAKGTEFTKILVFGLSATSIPMGLEAYDYDEAEHKDAMLRERSLLYVAASRARDELVITYSGEPSELLPRH